MWINWKKGQARKRLHNGDDVEGYRDSNTEGNPPEDGVIDSESDDPSFKLSEEGKAFLETACGSYLDWKPGHLCNRLTVVVSLLHVYFVLSCPCNSLWFRDSRLHQKSSQLLTGKHATTLVKNRHFQHNNYINEHYIGWYLFGTTAQKYQKLLSIISRFALKLTGGNSNGPVITSNRISHSTCVCSPITSSNIINGVISTEHCTSISMSHCSNTSGLYYWTTILPPCKCVWGRTSWGTGQCEGRTNSNCYSRWWWRVYNWSSCVEKWKMANNEMMGYISSDSLLPLKYTPTLMVWFIIELFIMTHE